MKKYVFSSILAMSLVFVGCKNENKDNKEEEMMEETTEMQSDAMESEKQMQSKKVTVSLAGKSDSNVSGNVVFKEEDGQVKMTAVFEGLQEGTHAIHLHETGDCSGSDGKTAGGHWNPTNEQHSKWGDSEGYHKGDIGNFEADANGNGTVSMTTDEWCIGCDDENKNIVGRAVIVHQGGDDFTSQPSGDAGSRVACGAVDM